MYKKIQELENEKGHLQEIKKVLDALNKELIINKEKQNEKCYTFDINMELFNALTRESDIRKIYYPTINEKNKISLIIDANSFYFYFASKINWLACDYSNFIEYLKFYIRIFLSIKDIKNIFFVLDGIEPFNKINSGTSLKRTKSKDKRIFNKIRHNLINNNIRKSIDDKIIAYNPFYPPPLCILIYMIELRKISKNLKNYRFPVNLRIVQAEYEADVIVAKYARKYNGFIIGNDSDYLIYESPGYIPLDSINLPDIKKVDYPCNEKWKINATLWKNKSLCYILGFSSLYMPIFATLCGNDYIDSFKVPMEFVKEYTKTLINYYIIDNIENEKCNVKTIIRNINKEINVFNDKDSLKEVLEESPKLKEKIDGIIKSKINKINYQRNKNDLIDIKDDDLYNIGSILYKKNYLKILIEYLKKKISQSEKEILSNSNENISQEREKNKELLIQSVLSQITKDKNEVEEYYQKLFSLVKVYLSNDKFIEKHEFSQFINNQNVSKISDYFSKGMFYGKSLKVLKYKTFHCSPFLDNVFNDSCWEITNNLRKEFYSILFSIYSDYNKKESIIIEEYKRKKFELSEDEIIEMEVNDEDERINNIYIIIETDNTSIESIPKRKILKYYINKYVNEDIIINLQNISNLERGKFNLYKKIFYSDSIRINSLKKIYIPIATSLRYIVIESYKMNPSNALTDREFSALLASIVSSMSNLLGVHNTNDNNLLKSKHMARPLPKNKVTKMTLNFIHRFSQFQSIIFLNIYILSALSLLDSSFLVNKNNVSYNLHEYCWGYGFHKFLEYFKTIDYLQNDKGERIGPFRSNYLNNEFRIIFNVVTENIRDYIVEDKSKPFLKYFYKHK
ncbi:hypothetical protein LY90DRAFT_671705 [Neocallimastix californiae]|uniref:Asteroid domain-containing protein n=1 Tax=Neocallimastix californiae TaxID=1754190 RepID=A0A1Y2C911_9FUNG|nr:hypothetical protein LY90DRAFT_671705 [Neocallimastix californiae]|eukprot:ORY43523.1 hypothetical protein LY90DRAFT_671705 [Neocallimastix californiae]